MKNCVTHHACDCIMAERDKLRAENARLRKALKYYSDYDNYRSLHPVSRGDGSYDYDVFILIDGGTIARKALEASDAT